MIKAILRFREEFAINQDIALTGLDENDIDLIRSALSAINEIYAEMAMNGYIPQILSFQAELKKSFALKRETFVDKRKKGHMSTEILEILTGHLGVDLMNTWFSSANLSGIRLSVAPEDECLGLKYRLLEDYSYEPMPERSTFSKYYTSGNGKAVAMLIDHFSQFDESSDLFEKYNILQNFQRYHGQLKYGESDDAFYEPILESIKRNERRISLALDASNKLRTFKDIPLSFLERISANGFRAEVTRIAKDNIHLNSPRHTTSVNKILRRTIVPNLYERLVSIGLKEEVEQEIFDILPSSSLNLNLDKIGAPERIAQAIGYLITSSTLNGEEARDLVDKYLLSTTGMFSARHAMSIMEGITNASEPGLYGRLGNIDDRAIGALDGLGKIYQLYEKECVEELGKNKTTLSWMKQSSVIKKLKISSALGL